MLGRLLMLCRWYFTGKRIMCVRRIEDVTVQLGMGTIVSGVIRRDESHRPMDMDLFWRPDGLYSISDIRRVPITSFRRDRKLGIVFNG